MSPSTQVGDPWATSGKLQEAFVQRIRELDHDRLLAVPIDVGKHTGRGVRLLGKVVVAPFTFSLNDGGSRP